ncbi:MAG: T9SS type A sorting domain-containing protein [Gemmatimonadetes bacterium]|nr:T9SS type A sorting domain-containing protein [Gemmatimonadota bacterium]
MPGYRCHTLMPTSALLALLLIPSITDAQYTMKRIANNLPRPLYVAQPPGDSERLFIVSQNGAIYIHEAGAVKAEPFLDITGVVESQEQGEKGLLSMQFHPEYETNGHFYVYYTVGVTKPTRFSIVERYTVSANPDSADSASAHQIIKIHQPQSNHNGAQILFGPDDYLYLGLGDGGGAPSGAPQNPDTLLGKMLRIDVDGDDFPLDPGRNYAIPPDNPFVDSVGVLDEIWAIGLRNPARFNFDRVTGDLYIADVGQVKKEEINFQPASSTGGENYGWSVMEGTACRDTLDPMCFDPKFRKPTYDYDHGPACASVVGGAVYRGSAIPSLYGKYIFTDTCFPNYPIWSANVLGDTLVNFVDETANMAPDSGGSLSLIVAINEDNAGELYFSENRITTGELWKLVPDATATDVRPVDLAERSLTITPAEPNPFTRTTRFSIRLAADEDLEVSIYSASGRLVRALHRGPTGSPGLTLAWDGTNTLGRRVAAGVYFVRARTEDTVSTGRVTLLK